MNNLECLYELNHKVSENKFFLMMISNSCSTEDPSPTMYELTRSIEFCDMTYNVNHTYGSVMSFLVHVHQPKPLTGWSKDTKNMFLHKTLYQ